MMKKWTLTAAFSAIALLAVAQHTQHNWEALFITKKLNDKWSIHTDIQWRSADDWKRTQSLILRPGINYHLTKNLSATVGYAYIPIDYHINDQHKFIPEHRIWEQLMLSHHLKLGEQNNMHIAHRLRLEERFIPQVSENNGTIAHDYETASRIRYFLRSLTMLNPQHKHKGSFIALQNEIFANFDDRVFDQNRAYGAVGYRFGKGFDIETGYMHLYNRNHVNRHIIQLAGYIRLP